MERKRNSDVIIVEYYLCKRLVCSRQSLVRTSAAVLYALLILLRSFFTSWPLRHYSFSRGLLTRASPSHSKKIRHSPSPNSRNLPRRAELTTIARMYTYIWFTYNCRRKVTWKTYATVLPNRIF